MPNQISHTASELAEEFMRHIPTWEGDVFTCPCGYSAKNTHSLDDGPEVPDEFMTHQMDHLIEFMGNTHEAVEQEIEDRVSRETDLMSIRQQATHVAANLFRERSMTPFLASDSVLSVAKRITNYVVNGTDDD